MRRGPIELAGMAHRLDESASDGQHS
jgi:hypothetical protein